MTALSPGAGTNRHLRPTQVIALIYVASLPFDSLEVFGRSLPFVLGLCYLLVALPLRLTARTSTLPACAPIGSVLPSIAFVAYCAFTYFWSITPDQSLSRVTTLAVLISTFWLLTGDIGDLQKAVPVAFVAGALLAALFVLTASASIDGRRTANGNANDVALALMVALGCSVWLAVETRGTSRILGVGAIPVLLAGTVATGSRSAVLSGAAMVLVVAVWLLARRQFRKALAMLTVIATAWITLVALPRAMVPVRLLSIDTALSEGSFSGREVLWRVIVVHGLDLWGLGAGSTPAYLANAIGSAHVAHNVILGILLELGVVGLLIFAGVVICAIRDGRRSPFSHLLVFLAPILLIGSVTLSLEARRTFWFVIALAWVSVKRNTDGVTKPSGVRPIRVEEAQQVSAPSPQGRTLPIRGSKILNAKSPKTAAST